MILFAQGGESYGKKSLWNWASAGNITTLSGVHVLPYANGLYNLGASGTAWNLGYIDSLYLNNIQLGTNGVASGVLNFIASDNDQANIAISTADALVLSGFSGGLQMGDVATAMADNIFSASGDIKLAFQTNGGNSNNEKWFIQMTGNDVASDFRIYNNAISATNAFYIDGGTGRVYNGYGLELGYNTGTSGALYFVMSDNDLFNITGTTADQMTFNGASGGYVFDAPILGSAGSASAPTYSFSGDSDVGFYYGGAKRIAIAIDGAEKYMFGDGTNTALTFEGDATLRYGGADKILMVRGANAQTFRIYDEDNTGSNDRYTNLGWLADSSFAIDLDISGTKTQRPLAFTDFSAYTIDNNLTIGEGGAGVDYTVTFNGETNDGVITYIEDEDRFDFDNDVNIGGEITVTGGILPRYLSGALTDGAPTDAEIDGITSSTPAGLGAGYMFLIKDTDGSGLIYTIISDGTAWQYTAMTIAL